MARKACKVMIRSICSEGVVRCLDQPPNPLQYHPRPYLKPARQIPDKTKRLIITLSIPWQVLSSIVEYTTESSVKRLQVDSTFEPDTVDTCKTFVGVCSRALSQVNTLPNISYIRA